MSGSSELEQKALVRASGFFLHAPIEETALMALSQEALAIWCHARVLDIYRDLDRMTLLEQIYEMAHVLVDFLREYHED